MIVITSEEINNLILNYFRNEGYCHSYYTFSNESRPKTPKNDGVFTFYQPQNTLYTLKDIIKKGVQHIYIEKHLDKNCNNRFSISEEHRCDIKQLEFNISELPITTNTMVIKYKEEDIIIGTSSGMLYRKKEENTIERNIGREVTALEIYNSTIAVGCYAGEIFFLNDTLDIIKEYKFHDGPVFAIKNRNNKYLCGSYDGKISIVKGIEDNNDSIDKNIVYPVHNSSVYDVEWLSDNYIASCSADRTIAITNIINKKSEILKYHKNDVNSIKLYKSNMLVSCSDDSTVVVTKIIFDGNKKDNIIKTKKECIFSHTNRVLCLETSPTHILSGSTDHTLRLWSIEDIDGSNNYNNKNIFYHDKSVYSIAYNINHNIIVSGSLDRSVRFWDSRYGMIAKYNAKGAVYEVQTKGSKVAIAVEDNNAVLLDIRMVK